MYLRMFDEYILEMNDLGLGIPNHSVSSLKGLIPIPGGYIAFTQFVSKTYVHVYIWLVVVFGITFFSRI